MAKNDRFTMTATFRVTEPQGIALMAMFDYWNQLAAQGSSRMVSFYVDGDGDFKPRAYVAFHHDMPVITDEMKKMCVVGGLSDGNLKFDYDPVAWYLSERDEKIRQAIMQDHAEFQQEAAQQRAPNRSVADTPPDAGGGLPPTDPTAK